MSYEDLANKYRLDDICPEIDNELHDMFTDLLGDDYELGIFPEESSDKKDGFLVTVEIVADGVSLDANQAKSIKTSVEERLAYNIGKDWKVVQKHFVGVQIYLNEELLN